MQTFPQVEAVILEQLEAGNYRLSQHEHYTYNVYLTIPKTGNNPKIQISSGNYFWSSEKGEYYLGRFAHVFDDVYLKRLFNSQWIQIGDPKVKNKIESIIMNYMADESKKRVEQLAKDDAKWADVFRKAFNNE